jgi:hypothetical protein
MLTDAQFTSVTRRTAQCVSLNQTDPVWRYFFTFKHTLPALAALGSYHGMELFYVFNNWENATLGEGLFFKPQDDSVQKAMLQYWVNFANTGNPNGANLVNWPRYQNSLDNYLEIKAKPDGMQNGIRTIYSDFWDEVSGFSACTSSLYNEYPTDNSDVKVFPNPTSGILWIEPGNYSEPWTIDIFDVNGKKILSDVNLNKVDISGFCAGIYLINIIQNGKIHRVKILRQS